jgi:hypothetical protein
MEKIKIDFGGGEFLLDPSSHEFDNQLGVIEYNLSDGFGREISTNGCPLLWQSFIAQFKALIERFKAELSSGKDVSWVKPEFAKYSLLFVAFSTFSRNDDYTSEAFEEAKQFHDSGFQRVLIEAGAVFRSGFNEANQLLGMSAQSKRRDACIVFIDTLVTHFEFNLDSIVNSNQDKDEETQRQFLKELNNILNNSDLDSDFDIKSKWDLLIRQVQEKASQILAIEALKKSVDKISKDAEIVLETKRQLGRIEPLDEHWKKKRDQHFRNVWWLFAFVLVLLWIGHSQLDGLLSFNGACKDNQTSSWVQFFDNAIRCWRVEKAILFFSVWAWTVTQIFHFLRSQWHLYNDASERIVMAKSYKLLQSDSQFGGDQGQTNKASFMILEALLRQADDGLMKDSPKANLLPIGLIKQSND